ncbi:MutS-related protein [Phocaeicola sp.]
MSITDQTAYHSFAQKNHPDAALPENVCQDLNIDDLFEELDFTTSCVGRQYLYHLLCTDRQSKVAVHEDFIKKLGACPALRDKLVHTLKKVSHPDAYSIVELLAEEGHHYSQRYLLLLQVCRWLPLLFAALMFVVSSPAIPFVLLLISYIGNGVLHFKVKNALPNYFFSIPQLRKLLLVTEELVKEPSFVEVDAHIKELPSRLNGLQKKLSMFRFGIGLEGDSALVVYLFTELINIFFLVATLNVVHSFVAIHHRKKEIEQEFCFVGFLDALCSLSYFRQSVPYWCLPVSSESGNLHAEGIFHPLIKDCVSNDLALTNKSMLITGSNMSGKTSFIRTVGVNLLMAKALNTCTAHTFMIDLDLRLYSVIHTEDDLLEGKSYFFKEAENVKNALARGGEGNYLFLFDELFKGTNTLERIAINAAVFSNLIKNNNIVLASTHDLKLAELLSHDYELYHFCETVSDDSLSFDYKLKKGVVKEGNAIRILKLCGYPQEVVDASLKFVSM